MFRWRPYLNPRRSSVRPYAGQNRFPTVLFGRQVFGALLSPPLSWRLFPTPVRVAWLLLQHVRLPMSTLVFIYGGNLVYVNISLYYMLRNIVNSNPHPAFVLNDVLLECLSVSLCLLLLLTVSQITMQVSA